MVWPAGRLLFIEVSDLRRARCGRGSGGSRLQRSERTLVGLSHEADLSEARASSLGGQFRQWSFPLGRGI